MKPVLTFFAILALTVPAVAFTQLQDRNHVTVAADAADQSNDWNGRQQAGQGPSRGLEDIDGVQAGGIRATKVAARAGVVVRRAPGRRGLVARRFVYRGRTLDAIIRPAFVYPRGFAYRRWAAGQLFPLALIAAPFFFLEYEALGLRAPPPEYRWVRYGPDVVLVNERTREIEDVAYGAIEDEEG